MPRLPRLFIPHGIYHVISRGVKQSAIFLSDDDRYDFLRLIRLTRDEEPFRLLAYCLMDNHYHLLMQPTEGSLSKIMQSINSVYANRYNLRHGLSGHVLQGRFHSIPVESDKYLTTVSRYIHLNPVRAGIVRAPEDYRWSNYRAVIHGTQNLLTEPDFVLGYFGHDVNYQRAAYKQFVEQGLNVDEPITEKVIWKMRQWGNPLQKTLKAKGNHTAVSQIRE